MHPLHYYIKSGQDIQIILHCKYVSSYTEISLTEMTAKMNDIISFTWDEQNNGNTREYRNKTVRVRYTERTLVVSIFHYSFVCLRCVGPLSIHYRLFSNSSCESTAKWETCQIFKEDRLLVHIQLEHL